MNDMKTLKSTLTLLAVGFSFSAMAQNGTPPPKSYNDKLMPEVQIGTLMCKDDYGKLMKCNGDEFDQIAGFATSSPYITINKKDSKDTEVGFIALGNGSLSVGDYVSSAPNGLVAKCEKQNAYAKVSSISGNSIRVKILSK
jgi:hypothetical protein